METAIAAVLFTVLIEKAAHRACMKYRNRFWAAAIIIAVLVMSLLAALFEKIWLLPVLLLLL